MQSSAANPNYLFLINQVPRQRVTLLQGGTRSGKTYSTVDYLIKLCLDYPNAGIEIDIVRDTFKALKATVWKDFINELIRFGLYNADNYNKTDCIYRLNGNIVTGYGLDDDAKVHGRARDILFGNEAQTIKKEVVDQLMPRTRHRVIFDYNPALGIDHWLDPYIIQYPPLITTYKDNPHLTAAQISDIESKQDDPYWWKIYGTGQRASREGVIFENWSEGEFPEHLPYCYGQDYGFSKDPTTLIRVAVDRRAMKIYVQELLYSKDVRLGTNDIARLNKSLILRPNDLIVGDSHGLQGRTIYDLQAQGLNIIASTIFSHFINEGITSMSDYEIIVTPESHNVKKELNNYTWSNRKAGIPIDDYNHTIDPIRYAFDALTQKRRTTYK